MQNYIAMKMQTTSVTIEENAPITPSKNRKLEQL